MARKVKMGIVAHDNQTNKSDNYVEIFKEIFQETDFDATVGWSNVNELIEVVDKEGVSLLNELGKIVVLDEGFRDQIHITTMINEFISLQEIFQNRGVVKPELVYMTGKQDVFDAFKKDQSPEGHPMFSYAKARLYKLTLDSNGSPTTADIMDIVEGKLDDKALGLKTEYQDRTTLAKEKLDELKDGKQSKEDDDQVKMLIKALKEDDQDEEPEGPTREKKTVLRHEKVIPEDNDAIGNQYNDKDIIEKLSKIKQIKSKLDHLENNPMNAKIKNDTGMLNLVGVPGSGLSSISLNLANFYASTGKKTLLVNLTSRDHLSKYSDFGNLYQKLNRKLPLQTDAKTIESISVPVVENLDIISNLGIEQAASIGNDMIQMIKRQSSEYEIVLFMTDTQDVINSVNKNVLFVTDPNDLSDIEAFDFKDSLVQIIINQSEYAMSKSDMYDKIRLINGHNDRSSLLLTISHSERWHLQVDSKVPIIFWDNLQMINFRSIAKKVII